MSSELDNALLLVNVVRVFHGESPIDELPLGQRSNAECCTVARALGRFVSLDSYWNPRESRWVPLPPRLVKFIRDFDAGKYPQLLEEDQ